MSVTSQVLVLNKSWVPISITSVESAILKLFSYCTTGVHQGQPKARIIDPTLDFQAFTWSDWSNLKPMPGEGTIGGINKKYRLFDVIQLTEYDKQPVHRLQFSRRTIWKRDSHRCQYCGCRISDKPGFEGTLDHILPKSRGGDTSWTNCVLACIVCNGQKANRLPEEAVKGKNHNNWRGPSPMKLLSVPKKPKMTMFKNDRYKMRPNWTSFLDVVSAAYWSVELENDNPE